MWAAYQILRFLTGLLTMFFAAVMLCVGTDPRAMPIYSVLLVLGTAIWVLVVTEDG